MMRALRALRALGPIDLRNVFRDSALAWMVLIPVLTAVLLRWGVPPLAERLLGQFGFDLRPYYPVLLSYLVVLMTPVVFGVVIGFLLLDERDDRTLMALRVTPLPLTGYLAYRVAAPIVLAFALTFVLLPIVGLGAPGPSGVALTALAAAPMAPLFALFLATFAENKVQGFALIKGAGVILFAPILAYFTGSGWALLFGALPTYWPLRVYWLVDAGAGGAVPVAAAGVGYQLILIALLLRRFQNVLGRS